MFRRKKKVPSNCYIGKDGKMHCETKNPKINKNISHHSHQIQNNKKAKSLTVC